MPILERYRDKICTYNDDIQGTAAVALAGIFGALRISRQKLTDQRFLFLGGGSAATGIAELISQAMALEGMDILAARAPQCAVRHQRTDGRPRAPISRIFRSPSRMITRRSPNSSTRSKRSGRPASSASAPCRNCSISRSSRRWRSSTQRPIIFPYSNPTSRSECTAEEAYRWSQGRAIFASGSPFPPVEIAGQTFVPGQGNNVYIFPAMGMAVFATEANTRHRGNVHRRGQGRGRTSDRGEVWPKG